MKGQVGVGITIAHDPLHGSGRADFPHPALALGDDTHAAQRIGMTDRRQRQPASNETPHAIPKDAAVLAPPRQRAMPIPADSEPKNRQRRLVHGHSVVAKVSTHNRPQPLALFGDGFVHSSLKLGFHRIQLRLQPFAYRLPQHREPSIAPLLHTDVREAQEVERLRFPFSTPPALVDRERTKLQQPRFLGMQFQVELPHSLGKSRPKLIGIRFAVKSNHDVIGKSHHDQIAVRMLLTPRLDPQVEYVMKIDVRQKRRSTSALGRPFFRPYSFPILQHAGPQPFLDKSHDAPVCRVRWWRGSGLRMMPTFPPPPLSFRTAGFPQYGWKVGLSGSAFPRVAQVKPAPGMPCTSRRFVSALRALRNHTLRPALCRNSEFGSALPCEELSPLPQRPSLRSGFYCPSPSTLNRPHPSHSQAHPDFAAWRFIRNALAVLVRLGDPRVVPCFRCLFLLDMSPSSTPGSSSAAFTQFLCRRRWPSPFPNGFGTPKYPTIRFKWAMAFGALPVHIATTCRVARLPWRIRPALLRPTEAFTPGLPSGWSPFPMPGITTVATGQAPPTGLAPAGTTASIAALGNPIEKALDVQIEHPVHFSRQQPRVERVQRLMLASPWPEPVRKPEEVRFIDGIQHLDRRTLDNLVFQHRDSERSLPPVGLRDKHPTHRHRSVRSALQPIGKSLEIFFQLLAVVPPRLPVHARCGFLLQSEVGPAQCFQVVDVVQERREPQLLILSCCLTYPLQRTRRVVPARCPGRVLLGQVPFGQTSSLHPLRHRLPGVVRRLLRYYRSVRLPRSVRHRRTSLDFPMRPRATADLGELGISRFPCEVPPYVLGVSDRAGLWYTSRYRCTRWGLPLLLTASASRRKVLTRLNTRPARSPVNASTPPLRAAPHDSGPMWVADPLSYDFFIHYTSPVLTGAQGERR